MKKIFTLIAAVLMAVGVNAETLIDFEQNQEKGITLSGTTAIATVKIHNADPISGIKFANGYTSDGVLNDNYALLTVDGGFKAGDKIVIAGAFNNSDNTKKAAVAVFTVDGETPTVLFTTQQFINGKDKEADPVAEEFVLEADADKLYLGRDGNTQTFVTTLKVIRGEESVTPDPDPDPVLPLSDPKVWDFTTTTADMLGDGWVADSGVEGRYAYATETAADTFLDLGEIGFSYGAGISVGRSGGKLKESAIRVDLGKQIQINSSDGTYKITGLAKDDAVKIRFASASSSEERSFTVLNGDKTSITATISEVTTEDGDVVKKADVVEEEIIVAKNGDLTLIQSKGINVKAISINSDLPAVTDGIETVKAASSDNGAIYNIAGQQVRSAVKGVYIQNGKKFIVK
jgi:hypothetical protein